MYGAFLIILLGLLLAFALGSVLLTGMDAEPAAETDPYADEIARFRTELHDWDRQ